MKKIHFRILVIVSFFLSIFGGFADLIISDPIVNQITEFAESIEPEWSDAKLFTILGFVILWIIYIIYTFVGLLLFWNIARHIYLAGFIIIIPMYFIVGVTVTSGIEQALYDAGSVLSGVLLALIYFSPVKQFFVGKSNRN